MAGPLPNVDLTVNSSGVINGAIYANQFQQPVGTGVFQPFLDLQAPGNDQFEDAFNKPVGLNFDNARDHWNNALKFGDLQQFTLPTGTYVAFVLDANEPGGNKSLISIDNFRVYTSPTDTSASVANNLANLDSLGTLRYTMNQPVAGADDGYNIENWVKLDANQNNMGANANGGSGQADMVVYVPVSAFGNTGADDFVWVYNLNGVHYAADVDLASTSGFEEWSALTAPRTNVPDGGATAALIGLGLLGLGAVRRKQS